LPSWAKAWSNGRLTIAMMAVPSADGRMIGFPSTTSPTVRPPPMGAAYAAVIAWVSSTTWAGEVTLSSSTIAGMSFTVVNVARCAASLVDSALLGRKLAAS
jgi:hypothetical protein